MKVTITLTDLEVPLQLIGQPNPIEVGITKTDTGYRDDIDLSTAFGTADVIAAALHILQSSQGSDFANLTAAIYQNAAAEEQAKQEVPRVESPRVPRTRN